MIKYADTLKRLREDFAAGPKWHDDDTTREYNSHMAEWERDGTHKNLVDAAIIQNIKMEIARRRAAELMHQYQDVTGEPASRILAKRLAKFRQYQDIPFPKPNV